MAGRPCLRAPITLDVSTGDTSKHLISKNYLHTILTKAENILDVRNGHTSPIKPYVVGSNPALGTIVKKDSYGIGRSTINIPR